MAAVIARRLQAGWVVNLGIGIPTLASSSVDQLRITSILDSWTPERTNANFRPSGCTP